MKVAKVALALLCLWLGSVLHESFLGRTAILGMQPDFVTLIVLLAAVRTRPGVAALTGFVGGLLLGGPAGADLSAYLVSRTLAAFGVSFAVLTGIQITSWSTAALVLVGTAVSQVLFLFLAPTPDIARFLGVTIGTAITNGVVAGFLDALLRRTLEKQVD